MPGRIITDCIGTKRRSHFPLIATIVLQDASIATMFPSSRQLTRALEAAETRFIDYVKPGVRSIEESWKGREKRYALEELDSGPPGMKAAQVVAVVKVVPVSRIENFVVHASDIEWLVWKENKPLSAE